MKSDVGRLRSLAMHDAVPAIVWAGAFALLAATSAAALPWLGATYDFYRGRTIQGHVTERSAMPLLVAQNGAGNMLFLAALIGCYWLAFGAYERMLGRFHAGAAAAAFAVGVVALAALPVLATSDPYAYALYGLESGPLDTNPYRAAVSGITGPWASTLLDMFPNAHAPVRTCNYGPFFALVYGGLAIALQHVSLLAFLLAERVFGIAAIALAALGLAAAVPNETASMRVRRAFAFALHPLVVMEFVAFAHGDILMLAALTWAYAAWRRGQVMASGTLCGIAACTRVVALVAVAALVTALARRDRGAALRACGGVLASVAFLTLCSEIRFHAFSFGGQPVFSLGTAPLIAFVGYFLPTLRPDAGLYLEEGLGTALIVALLLRVLSGGAPSLLGWLPFAALAGAPALYPHYIAWAAPLQSLSSDVRLLRVFRMLGLAAPLLYVTHIDPFAPPGAPLAVQLAVLAAVWLTGILAFRTPARMAVTTSS